MSLKKKKCPLCDERFWTQTRLLIHIFVTHEGRLRAILNAAIDAARAEAEKQVPGPSDATTVGRDSIPLADRGPFL